MTYRRLKSPLTQEEAANLGSLLEPVVIKRVYEELAPVGVESFFDNRTMRRWNTSKGYNNGQKYFPSDNGQWENRPLDDVIALHLWPGSWGEGERAGGDVTDGCRNKVWDARHDGLLTPVILALEATTTTSNDTFNVFSYSRILINQDKVKQIDNCLRIPHIDGVLVAMLQPLTGKFAWHIYGAGENETGRWSWGQYEFDSLFTHELGNGHGGWIKQASLEDLVRYGVETHLLHRHGYPSPIPPASHWSHDTDIKDAINDGRYSPVFNSMGCKYKPSHR